VLVQKQQLHITGFCTIKQTSDDFTVRLCVEGARATVLGLVASVNRLAGVEVPLQEKESSCPTRFFDTFSVHFEGLIGPMKLDLPALSLEEPAPPPVGKVFSPEAPKRGIDMSPPSGTSPLQYRKVRTIQNNDSKFVFEVHGPENEALVMKETTMAAGNKKADADRNELRNEFMALVAVHSSDDDAGAAPTAGPAACSPPRAPRASCLFPPCLTRTSARR
jgi:hypothetical protein